MALQVGGTIGLVGHHATETGVDTSAGFDLCIGTREGRNGALFGVGVGMGHAEHLNTDVGQVWMVDDIEGDLSIGVGLPQDAATQNGLGNASRIVHRS